MSVPSRRYNVPLFLFSFPSRWRETQKCDVFALRVLRPRDFSSSANFSTTKPCAHPPNVLFSCHWLDSSVCEHYYFGDIRVGYSRVFWISSWHVLPTTEHHGKYKIRHVVVGRILRSRLKDTLMAITNVRDISRSFARLVVSFVLSTVVVLT